MKCIRVKQIIEKEKIEKWGFGSVNWLLIGWRQISMRAVITN